jgi:hypothetical protein
MLFVAIRPGAAAPPVTVIQDTLYKADGSRFDGLAQIEWKSFRSSDGSEIPQNAINVAVVNGYVKTSLVPTTNAIAPAYYTVRYNSAGRTQFIEYWAVPPSSAPLRISDVRTHGPLAGPIAAPSTTMAIQDVSGLRTELDLRPAKGTTWVNGRAAVIGSNGAIESALGYPGDCVRVNGTTGPCGDGGLLFIDGETPLGALNGSNTVFWLSAPPVPGSSLSLFRNGVLLRAGVEYSLTSNVISFAALSAPQAGDLLQAWYRIASGASVTIDIVNGEMLVGLVNGSNPLFSVTSAPKPASSLQVYRNGLLQKAGVDYTTSVNTITFTSVSIPQPGDILQASYRK